MKTFIIILFSIITSFTFAQKVKMPADFRLEYKYDAGMFPLREDLKLFSGNGTYKAYENGKDFEIKFTSKDKEEIQELHGKLSACSFFRLSLKADERYLNPKEDIKDKGSKTIYIVASAKHYFLSEDDFSTMDKDQAAVAKKAFEIVQEFTKKYRK
jgi:hypothetical protein